MAGKVTLGDSLLFPSEYICAFDLGGQDLTLTIASIAKEELRVRNGGKAPKPVMKFKEPNVKPIVLNKTNADSIASMYGNRAEGWVGKTVVLYATKTMFGRDQVECIRIREGDGAPPQAPTHSPYIVEFTKSLKAIEGKGLTNLELAGECNQMIEAYHQSVPKEEKAAYWNELKGFAKFVGVKYNGKSFEGVEAAASREPGQEG